MSSAIWPAASLPGLMWDVKKSPSFRTAVQQAVGGREVRVAYQPYPIWTWKLAFEFLRETTGLTEFQILAGFYTARQGRFDSFLFEDPTDYLIADTDSTTRQTFGTGDGSTLTFQLGRKLAPLATYPGLFEPIYNLNATPKIYKNDVLQTTPANYSVSATGLVTFAVAPAAAAVLKWSGSYYWRVRFGEDASTFENFVQAFWRNQEITLVQLLGL